MKKVLKAVGVVALVAVFVVAIVAGESRQEVVDCNTWAQQATVYPSFYLTHWQADQCAAHNITVNAPVK